MQRLFVLVLVAGCSATPPPRDREGADLGPGSPARLSVLMLGDGQQVTLVEGAQGGFHVWMQYAVRDLPPATYTLERSARRVSDGAPVLVYRGDVDIGAAGADGVWSAPAPIPMFMCPSPIGISVIDVSIAFSLRVLGAGDAELARTAITLVPRCPEAQRDFCTRICSG